MADAEEAWRVTFAGPARRHISLQIPEAVAVAVLEFCATALASNPHRVGSELGDPFEGCRSARRGAFRVVYAIDEERREVRVLRVMHRADVYRP